MVRLIKALRETGKDSNKISYFITRRTPAIFRGKKGAREKEGRERLALPWNNVAAALTAEIHLPASAGRKTPVYRGVGGPTAA